MSVEESNKKAKQYVTGKLDYASTLTEDDFSTLKNYHSLAQTLDHLINVKAMGFRGVVATAITGLYLSKVTVLCDYLCNVMRKVKQKQWQIFCRKVLQKLVRLGNQRVTIDLIFSFNGFIYATYCK
jgi:hypothetical protein